MMVKIKELIKLFEDERTKELLNETYKNTQKINKELSNKAFEKLYNLKKDNNKLDIIFDLELEDNPSFNSDEYIIHLNIATDEVGFLYQLGLLFTYCYSNNKISKEYKELVDNFVNDKDKQIELIQFVNKCREEYLKLSSKFSKEFQANFEEDSKVKTRRSGKDDSIGLFSLLAMIEDIINSITNSSDDSSYVDVIADYFTIQLVDPNNDLLLKLKEILGIKFIEYLDKELDCILNK